MSEGAPPLGLRRVYAQAVISNVCNLKIAIFFLAYLPQFANRSAEVGVALQLLFLGLAFALITWALFSVVAYFSGALGGWLRRRPKVANVLGWLTGGVLVGLGLRLGWPESR
jgi:threonine/homoserine/homoserine lactone efflux protein